MQKLRNKNIIAILYSIFIAIYPILCIYKGIGSVTIGDFILIGFTLYGLLHRMYKSKNFKFVFCFLIYVALSLFLNMNLSSVTFSYIPSVLIFRYAKLVLYFLSIFICNGKFFDFKIFKKAILCCSIICCAFLFLQYIMYYGFGKVITGHIPGLTIHLTEYAEIDYEYFYSHFFRPCSLLLEPASFCQYIIVGLIISLFDKKNNKVTLISLILSFGMILTTSGQGILYLFIVFFIFFNNKYKGGYKTLFFILIPIVVIMLYNYSDAFRFSFDRLFNENAQSARFGSYQYLFNMDFIHTVFGYGYGVTPNGEYLAGLVYVMYGSGIIGLIICLCIFFSFFKNSNNILSKLLCLLFFAMFLGTSLFYSYMLFWYFGLMEFFNNDENVMKGKLHNKTLK